MMYIGFRDLADSQWHVQDGKMYLSDQVVMNVQVIQADGHELHYIIDHMPNVPYVVNRAVNRWFGDMAKFIAANI